MWVAIRVKRVKREVVEAAHLFLLPDSMRSVLRLQIDLNNG
jgi:hypothetical protein